jgi:trimeric autotransporter adhesin
MWNGRKLPLTLAFALLVAVAFGASCRGFFTNPVLQSVAVGPATPQLQIGTTNDHQQMTAVGTYDDGTRPDSKVTWSIADAQGLNVATITAGGYVKAQNQGKATVTATSTEVPTLSGTATVTVTVCITKIDVKPVNPTVNVGTQVPFTATATICSGGTSDVTDVATWTSSDTSVATIDSSGNATTLTGGGKTTNITATAGGVTSPAQILTVN